MPKIGRKKHVQVSVVMTRDTRSLYKKVCRGMGDLFNYEIFEEMLKDYCKKHKIETGD